MRVDKFIWSVRLFKTRKLATEACLKERVKIDAITSKASKSVVNNAVISIYEKGIWRQFKVIDIPKSRIGTKLVEQFIIEITPESELIKLEQIREINRQNHSMGIKGRPTKKDRRDWEDFNG